MGDIAVVIIETEKDDAGNYIPCIVKEGVTGYYRSSWTWGKNKKLAEDCAKDYNHRLGLSDKEAMRLVLQSMKKHIPTAATMSIMVTATVPEKDMESVVDEIQHVLERYIPPSGHRSLVWKQIDGTPEDCIIIEVEGGIVEDVISEKPLKVFILDGDIEGTDADRLIEIEHKEYGVDIWDATVSPKRIAKMLRR